jgi:hypothetical protein
MGRNNVAASEPPRLAIVAENVGSADDDEPEFLRSPVDEAKLSERLRDLGEDAASHREAAELAQRTMEGLAMHALELRARAISSAWRELRYRERGLDQRARELDQREQALAKQRQALDALKGALADE